MRQAYLDKLIHPNDRLLRQLERRRYLKFNLDRLRLMQNASHA
ncbi:MAG: hypothetical protein P4M07_15555 [Xanthobacteraceae bacterium]|nr:hypothetical protein [Xanthobacteraceae bacterium]